MTKDTHIGQQHERHTSLKAIEVGTRHKRKWKRQNETIQYLDQTTLVQQGGCGVHQVCAALLKQRVVLEVVVRHLKGAKR